MGVGGSFLRPELEGASMLTGLAWCSGDLTEAPMMVCCRTLREHTPSSLRERSSIRIFCSASSSSEQRARSLSRATFMSLYCTGAWAWLGTGACDWDPAPPMRSSRRRPKMLCNGDRGFTSGWSILACKKSMSLVCCDIVPSILTFSWEYAACGGSRRLVGALRFQKICLIQSVLQALRQPEDQWSCTSSNSLCFSSRSVSNFCCRLRAFISSMACFFSRSLSFREEQGVTKGLLQGQDLRLVLFDCQLHRLAGLSTALVGTQPGAQRGRVDLKAAVSSSLCRSRALLSAWFFSSSRALRHASHCRSFSRSSSFRVSSSSTCSSSMVHVVFKVSMFYGDGAV
ncbi:hypothetical protein Z043_114485 [Scleropages formosus]|uniref:Uncharacterized protein n=1 Tax=Scleropages formosus TaxID=113540 RepID=A0A0P7WYL6_SCLFO|nr:hypothetical protein Z043_114485 [Scleropages formosus]